MRCLKRHLARHYHRLLAKPLDDRFCALSSITDRDYDEKRDTMSKRSKPATQ